MSREKGQAQDDWGQEVGNMQRADGDKIKVQAGEVCKKGGRFSGGGMSEQEAGIGTGREKDLKKKSAGVRPGASAGIRTKSNLNGES